MVFHDLSGKLNFNRRGCYPILGMLHKVVVNPLAPPGSSRLLKNMWSELAPQSRPRWAVCPRRCYVEFEFVTADTTKDHRLGGLDNSNVWSHSFASLRSRCGKGWSLLRTVRS